MKKTYLVITFSVVLLVAGLYGHVAGQDLFVKDVVDGGGSPEWVSGEIIVKFNPGVSDQAINALVSKHGASVITTSRFAGFKRLRVPPGKTVAEMVEIYSRNPNVEYAEPNFIAHAFWVPNDPLYSYQWHMEQIGMEAAWDITTGTSDVIVAVIDTGVAYEDYDEEIPLNRRKTKIIHYALAPDLAGTNFVPGYDFVNDDEHPNDDNGHGTHVAGTIAQTTNNDLGVAGVAPDVSIMPIKVLDSGGWGTYTDIADGIYWAANNGADIINMSLGGSSGSTTLEAALVYASDRDVTIVCAAGNDGSDTTVSYPAAYDAYCIAVGATRFDGTRAYYSNGGDSLDVMAPGGDLYVDQNGDSYGDGVFQQTFGSNPTDFGYYFYQGTSMATPHVSGVAALLISHGELTTPDEIQEALQSTAVDKGAPGWDSKYGYGIINAAAALNYEPGTGDNNPPVPDGGSTPMHVKDISMSVKKAGPNINAIATVTVVDDNETPLPVEGATVYGIWSGLTEDSDAGITDVNGAVSLSSNKVKNPRGTFTFTVTDIIKDGMTYDSPSDDSGSIEYP